VISWIKSVFYMQTIKRPYMTGSEVKWSEVKWSEVKWSEVKERVGKGREGK
jgi:hypothetical protein